MHIINAIIDEEELKSPLPRLEEVMISMSGKSIKRLTAAAMLAALTAAATMIIQVPSPMGGYVNLGDCFVLLSGWLLGPIWGGAAAGLGSMLTDIILGYAFWAPGSLVIKGLDAAAAAMIFKGLRRGRAARLVSGVCGEALMVLGYFCYSGLILGNGFAAAASISGDIVQGIMGIAASFILAEAFERIHLFSKLEKLEG